jgi:hypothetical protein
MNKVFPFSRLQHLLEELGFQEKVVPGSHIYFEHSPSGTLLLYHVYDSEEPLTWADFVKTRKFLDERGLLRREQFEERMDAASDPEGNGGRDRLANPDMNK